MNSASSYKIYFIISLYEGNKHSISLYTFCIKNLSRLFEIPWCNYIRKILIKGTTSPIKTFFSFLKDITLITEGETSDDFYFYTVPSTLPSNLECTASYNEDYGHMIELTWNDPTTFDLDEDSTYKYSYILIESMLQPEIFKIRSINL